MKLYLIMSLLLISTAFALDSSICQSPDPVNDYRACIAQQDSLKSAWEQKSDENDLLSKNFFASDSDYSICQHITCAKGATNPLTMTTIKTDNDQKFCLERICEPILLAYNRKLNELDAQETLLKQNFDVALCNNCIFPFCTYIMHGDCVSGGKFCAKIIGRSVDYEGCGQGIPPLPTTTQPPAAVQQPPTTTQQPAPTTQAKPTTTQPNTNEVKLNTIAQKNTVTEIKTKTGTKKVIVVNPDNSKATLADKAKYHVKNEVKTKFGDLISKIPIIGPYKDYVIKHFDDQQSDDEKIKDTQVKLGVGKNAAKQFNLMDGTGDKELSLSTGKNLIPSTPVTKPFEFILTQLGSGVTKTMAHGFNSEYNNALDHAKLLRDTGSTWSETIEQTTRLVGQDTDGKRWVQTLSAFSKPDYKTQDARIKAYIMQMKMNGELK